jgi:hypothetical protein
LIHLIRFGDQVRDRFPVRIRQKIGLQPMPQFQQMAVTAIQLMRQLQGGLALRDSSKNHHQFRRRPVRFVKDRLGECVEHSPADVALVIQHRLAMSPMHTPHLTCCFAPGTLQAIGMKVFNNKTVTGCLIHQISDWKLHGGSSLSFGPWST